MFWQVVYCEYSHKDGNALREVCKALSALKHDQAQRMTEVEMKAMPQNVPYTLLK